MNKTDYKESIEALKLEIEGLKKKVADLETRLGQITYVPYPVYYPYYQSPWSWTTICGNQLRQSGSSTQLNGAGNQQIG